MIIILLIFLLISSPVFASGWYSTLQGTASDVEQDIPSDGVILQWSSFYQKWLFAYGVAPSGGTTGQVLTKNSGSNYDYSWTTPSGGGTSWLANGNNIYSPNSGNVGIGTSVPTSTLQVNGSLSTANNTLDDGGGNAHFAGSLTTANNTLDDGTGGAVFAGGNFVINLNNFAFTGTGGGVVAILDGSALGFGDNIDLGSDGSALFASGSLKIDTGGNLTVASIIKTGGTSSQFLKADGSVDSTTYISSISPITLSGSNVGIGTTIPSALLEVGARKFDVLSTGNVGIGSILPSQKLDVNGTVRATSFMGGSTAGVNCSGTPTSSFATVDGIVTHC